MIKYSVAMRFECEYIFKALRTELTSWHLLVNVVMTVIIIIYLLSLAPPGMALLIGARHNILKRVQI